ncbi:MAG: CDP-alcohol phosphatidyltransferase family protein [Ruminiclostridium sp.]|nr:CDP-alcohol phosphatidyltransferase family protein [Ruminiclostridium sp.]
MDDKTKKEVFSIPNILTYFRILLIPVFVVLYINSKEDLSFHIASVLVVALSGLTDMLDGKIARHFNMITELGKIIDPVADKLTQCAIMVCLAVRYPLLWAFIGALVVKEITMAVLGMVFLKKGRKLKGAHWYGKVSTVVFYLVMMTLLVVPPVKMPFEVSLVLILVSGAFMIFSFIMYLTVYFNMARDIKENKPNKRY